MRATIVKLHRWVGLGFAAVIFVVFASGGLLVFDEELTRFLDRELAQETDRPVSLDTLRLAAQEQLWESEQVNRLYLPPGRIRVKGPAGKRFLYFHPEDGRFLGEGSQFSQTVMNIHRNLLLSKPGRWVTFISALGLLFQALSGLRLWWPRNSRALAHSLKLKFTASRRRLVLDIHRVIGFYLFLPVLILIATGLNYSVLSSEYRSLVLTLTSAPPPYTPSTVPEQTRLELSLDEATLIGQRVFPEATLSSLELPSKPGRSLVLRFHHPGQPGELGRSLVELNPATGEVLQSLDARSLALGHRLITVWALPLHRGRAFGLGHQVLWLLVAGLGMSLPLSAFWLWWRKGGA